MLFLLWSGPGALALGDRATPVVLRLVPLAVVLGAFAVVGAAGTERMAAAAELSAAAPSTAPAGDVAARRPALTIHASRYGRILSDGRGLALYAFTRDPRGGKSTCYGDCAEAWPPYIVKARPGAGSGVRGALIGTVRRTDGRLQATYNGRPLYYYVGDRQPGQVLCQDVFEYGGTWLVVRGTGALVR
jgi:predicted lipoprotein with Yx(FWY)xxD motif